MSTVKISIARPVIHVKPNRGRKIDVKAASPTQAAEPATGITAMKDACNPTHQEGVATLFRFLDAKLEGKLERTAGNIFVLHMMPELCSFLATCISITSNLFAFMQRWTPYPFLCTLLVILLYGTALAMTPKNTLMASLSIGLVTFHAHDITTSMWQLEAFICEWLSDMELCLSQTYFSLQSFVESAIDAQLTQPEGPVESSAPLGALGHQPQNNLPQGHQKDASFNPVLPAQIQWVDAHAYKVIAKLESATHGKDHSEFDMEGWLLVSSQKTSHLLVL